MDNPADTVPDPVRATSSASGRDRNWPLNHWWIVAHGSEVSTKPILRWVSELPVALYRTEAGALAALHDRCPHRWAPLSKGEVAGEDLICGYHGMRFAPSGACTKVPTQKAVPPIRVRAFPIVERFGFVWLWTGDESLADANLIPEDLAYLAETNWHCVWGYRSVNANYMRLQDNVLDLSHIAFLHKNTAGQSGWEQIPEVSVEGSKVTVRHYFDPEPLPLVFATESGKPLDKIIHRHTWTTQISPGLNDGSVVMHDPDPGDDELVDFEFRVVHIFVPVSPVKSHYFWVLARNYGKPFDIAAQRIATDKVLDEDVEITEAIQSLFQRTTDQESVIEYSVRADYAAIEGRRQLEILMKRDQDLH